MASSRPEKSGNQGQSTFPFMILMKGPSTNKKSEIARKLSAHLQYTLIDENDIIPSLENSIPNPSIGTTNDLAFKIITQITSTQLDSKINVIVNTPLSKYDEFLQLVELASRDFVFIFIIQCSSKDNNDHDSGVYDTRAFPNLTINMEETFEVEHFASKLLRLVKWVEGVDPEASEDQESKGSTSTELLLFDEKIRTQWHAHEFSIVTNTNATSLEKSSCNYCKKSISGATYNCIECDEFILHKECAELSDKLDHLKEKGPWYLCDNTPENAFSRKHKCKLCNNFSRACPNCLFQSHIESEFLPVIFKYEGHEHPLNFVVMPSWFNFIYKCCKCDKLGNSTSYKCYSCNFDLHLDCALPPPPPVDVVIAPPRLFNFFQDGLTSSRLFIGRNDLKFMPHQLQSGIALKNLFICSFDEVEALPEWLGNLASLQGLGIEKCKKLKQLPSATAFQGLSQLMELHIRDCPLLKESCAEGSGSEWSKISHIPFIEMDYKILP